MKFTVEIKNISGNVDSMKIAQGDTWKVPVEARDKHHAIGKACRRMFNGCGFSSENIQTGHGSQYGQLQHGGSQYGRIYVYCDQKGENSAE